MSDFEIDDKKIYVARLNIAEKKVREGRREWILVAIESCLATGIEAPPWLSTEVDNALERYFDGISRELGEAFGISRPKGWNQVAYQRECSLDRHELFQFVRSVCRDGGTISAGLEGAAEKYCMSFGKARAIYYEVKKEIFDEITQDFISEFGVDALR